MLLCEVGDPARLDRETRVRPLVRHWRRRAVLRRRQQPTGQAPARRLDFGGNRRINSVLHIASVTQARSQPDAAAYPVRETAEGKTRREARRAHERHLANRVIRRMWRDEKHRQQARLHAA